MPRKKPQMPTLLAQVEEAATRYHAAIAEADAARATLYAAVIRAAVEEIPFARIARSAGLSRERVRQIVAEAGQAGPSSR